MNENQVPKRPEDVERRIRRKRFWRRTRLIALFLLVVFVGGLAVAGFVILSPNIQTQVALPGSMTDSLTLPGIAAMDSVDISSSATMQLYYLVQAGQRVPSGTVVADAYASTEAAQARANLEQLDAEIARLEAAQSTYVETGDVENLLQQRQTEVYSLLNAIGSGNYANVNDPLANVTLAANKLEVATGTSVDYSARIAELTAQRNQYEAMAVVQSQITAPAGGYFVSSSRYDVQIASYEEIASLAPLQLQLRLQAPVQYYPNSVVGHIVSDYKWNLFLIAGQGEIERFSVGAKLSVAFPEYGDTTLPVTVQTVEMDEAAGIAKIELLCENINATVLELRNETVQVVFSTQTGIRIDKRALRMVDGTPGVFVKVGNVVRYRKVQILLEDENYILIPATVENGVNEVALYDDIIVDNGGLELYDQRIL